jgi:hypothetical protein
MRSRIPFLALSLAAALLLPTLVEATPPSGDPDDGEVIELEVDAKKKRPDWLFPGLDHPRVQAYFRSDSMVGSSLFDPEPQPPSQYPLVRAGMAIAVHGTISSAERREARRWARRMVADRLPSFEACYADARQRNDIDSRKIALRVTIAERERGTIAIAAGELGDAAGNDCLAGVLAFAERDAPSFSTPVELEVPVWFWLQTVRI